VRIPRRLVALAGLIILPLAWLAFAHVLKTRAFGPVLGAVPVPGRRRGGRRRVFRPGAFGQVKLAPQVSPGKTWEGLLGGLLLVALVGAAGAGGSASRWPGWSALALAVAGISVVGDLGISMLKRSAGLKDTGQLFPGHGGVLDRIDSLLAAIPLFVVGAALAGGP
jgi:phosphatidate cytidylyltransferase